MNLFALIPFCCWIVAFMNSLRPGFTDDWIRYAYVCGHNAHYILYIYAWFCWIRHSSSSGRAFVCSERVASRKKRVPSIENDDGLKESVWKTKKQLIFYLCLRKNNDEFYLFYTFYMPLSLTIWVQSIIGQLWTNWRIFFQILVIFLQNFDYISKNLKIVQLRQLRPIVSSLMHI